MSQMISKYFKCLKTFQMCQKISKYLETLQNVSKHLKMSEILPCVFNCFSMIIMSSVRKIEPDNIHSSFNQFGQFFDGTRNRSDRADDVRSAMSVIFGVDVQQTVVLQNCVRFLRRQLGSRIGQLSVAHFSNFLKKYK